MGVSPDHPLLVSLDLKGTIETDGTCKSDGSLWRRIMEARARRRWQVIRQSVNRRIIGGPRRMMMKRRARLEGYRTSGNAIGRRVRTLKKLIPNTSGSTTLDGLFTETAHYILSLQRRVEVMQVMVKVLTGSNNE